MVRVKEKVTIQLRTGHLLRIHGYLNMAILSMWMKSPRAEVLMGMAEASVRGRGPGGADEELLDQVRPLIRESREYYADDDFPPAISRMRVAQDLTALHIVRLAGESSGLLESSAGLPEDAPLAAAWRDAVAESVHRGRAVVCDPTGEILDATGDPDGYVYLRSSAKPFQALPLVLSGAADALRLSDEELAIICASHNGEARHLSVVRSILRKAGLSEDDLQSGAHPPMHGPAAARMARNGDKPRPIHGNCSGKHAGMLALCVHEGWETTGYRKPSHPAQQKILGSVASICGVERDEILVAGDQCGVPTFAMPLKNLAIGFARLATGEGVSGEMAEATRRIRDAMRSNPFMVAGTGRFDTDLMQATDLVSKSGAEAVFACGSQEGWGMAIKISDGSGRAVRPAAMAALSRQGAVSTGREVSELRDLHGEPVGEIGPLT